MKGGNGPALNGKRMLGRSITICVAAGGILDLASCVDGEDLGLWSRFSFVRYEAGAIVNLGALQGSTMVHYLNPNARVRVQCALDLGMEISNLDASQCSRECHHGGRPNSDCSACVDCDEGWDPAQDCAVCLPCNGDGDADDCSCTCLEGRSGPPNCDVNVCRTSVSSQAIHVLTSNYTSAKRRAQFVIHDGATFTGSSGSTEKPSIGTSYYYSNSFLILRG